jgi:hypothetical protein
VLVLKTVKDRCCPGWVREGPKNKTMRAADVMGLHQNIKH